MIKHQMKLVNGELNDLRKYSQTLMENGLKELDCIKKLNENDTAILADECRMSIIHKKNFMSACKDYYNKYNKDDKHDPKDVENNNQFQNFGNQLSLSEDIEIINNIPMKTKTMVLPFKDCIFYGINPKSQFKCLSSQNITLKTIEDIIATETQHFVTNNLQKYQQSPNLVILMDTEKDFIQLLNNLKNQDDLIVLLTQQKKIIDSNKLYAKIRQYKINIGNFNNRLPTRFANSCDQYFIENINKKLPKNHQFIIKYLEKNEEYVIYENTEVYRDKNVNLYGDQLEQLSNLGSSAKNKNMNINSEAIKLKAVQLNISTRHRRGRTRTKSIIELEQEIKNKTKDTNNHWNLPRSYSGRHLESNNDDYDNNDNNDAWEPFVPKDLYTDTEIDDLDKGELQSECVRFEIQNIHQKRHVTAKINGKIVKTDRKYFKAEKKLRELLKKYMKKTYDSNEDDDINTNMKPNSKKDKNIHQPIVIKKTKQKAQIKYKNDSFNVKINKSPIDQLELIFKKIEAKRKRWNLGKEILSLFINGESITKDDGDKFSEILNTNDESIIVMNLQCVK